MEPEASSVLLARWHGHAASDRAAVLDEDGEHTYRALGEGARRVATALLEESGGAPLQGERVALLAAAGAPFVEAFFGVLIAGGCVVVLSPLHPAPECEYFCRDAGVRTVLVSATLREHASQFAGRRRLLTPADWRARAPVAAPPFPSPVLVRESDAALQLYTSGTTGKPKGAILTHANLSTQQALIEKAWGWRSTDVLCHVLPLHHMHGLAIALLSALGAGACAHMLPRFDASETWGKMARASVFMAVPTIYAKLLAALDAADAPTRARWSAHARALRLATSGSAALPVTLAERWRAVAGA
jgi:malonyl-CoA/methylmalonyl-CoA synthetase